MTRKRRRMFFVVAGMISLGLATTLVLIAFQDNLVFFYSPTDVVEQGVEPDRRFRIGGLVEENSVSRTDGDITVAFRVTDQVHAVPVVFRGLLPDLFREGQGIVAEGTLNGEGVFVASEVLAKHDENYMPPEVADALKRSGQWKPDE